MSRSGHAVTSLKAPQGVGLGLRWEFLRELVEGPPLDLGFLEVSPENYMGRGGYYPAMLERLRERYPIVTHGLTLSIGAADAPDEGYVRELRREVQRLGTPWHSDHLCFSSAGTRVLHELFPLKRSAENVRRTIERVRQVQDALAVPMALENISYYAEPGRAEMPEHEFVSSVVEGAGIGLLLDVNNAFVNARNHRRDAQEFIRGLPLDRVVEIHVAGHRHENGLIIDSHGSPVSDPVLDLLAFTLARTGPVPVLLERDNDVPPLAELMLEIERIRCVYDRAQAAHEARGASEA